MSVKTIKDLKVLLVDDERETLEMLKEILEMLVKEVYMAEDGERGYQAFLTHHLDVIITDIKMPIMDGFEMSAKIRESNQEIPIIVLSAHTELDIAIKHPDLSFEEVFLKPVHPNKIRRLLEEIAKRGGDCDKSTNNK